MLTTSACDPSVPFRGPPPSASPGAAEGRQQPDSGIRAQGLDPGDFLEAAPDALVAAGSDGVIVLVNHQIERLFGYDRRELVGESIELLVPEKFREAHHRHRARYAADPYLRPTGTGRRLACRRKDGSEFWAEISLSPVRTSDNMLVICAIRDVTERLRAEDERADLLVRDQAAHAAAEAAIRQQDELLWVAAHELKTPVTSLRGYAQLLLRQLKSRGVLEAPGAARALEILDRSAGRLVELVDQLLDLSRIEAGQLVLERREVDLARLVRQAVEVAQARAGDHRLRVRAPAALLARVDAPRLEQVLTNLLDNAARFSPPGTPISVVLARTGAGARLSVRDRGPGIPPEHLARIFERFHQAHPGDRLTRKPGMGLGLYISREIVDLHGGRIEAQLPRGGGSRLVVSLPLDPRSAGA